MTLRLLALSSTRFYRRHPWQLILAIAGIALGVAVFVGIELANDSARRAFDASSAALRGQTTHRLLPVSGLINETDYLTLKHDRRFVLAAPVIEVPARLELPAGNSIALTLVGIDPIEQVALGDFASIAGIDVTRLLTEAGAIIVPGALAARFGIAPGDRLNLTVGANVSPVVVVGTADTSPAGSTIRRFIVRSRKAMTNGWHVMRSIRDHRCMSPVSIYRSKAAGRTTQASSPRPSVSRRPTARAICICMPTRYR